MIAEKIKALKEFDANVNNYIVEAFKKHEESIVRLNTDRIYKRGENIHGRKIRRPEYGGYSKGYKSLKQRKGLYQGFVDLHFEGKYLNDFHIRVKGNLIYIEGKRFSGTFDVAAHIRKVYNDPEGLSDKELNRVLRIIIKKELLRRINEYT